MWWQDFMRIKGNKSFGDLEGRKALAATARNNPLYIFLVPGNDQGAIQTIQPNFLILPGFELGPPSNQSLSWT